MSSADKTRQQVLDELRALAAKATPGPYFIAGDNADDIPAHRNSGLALIDTGRQSDWPVLRLGEWPTSQFVVALLNAWPEIEKALASSSYTPSPKVGLCYDGMMVDMTKLAMVDKWEPEMKARLTVEVHPAIEGEAALAWAKSALPESAPSTNAAPQGHSSPVKADHSPSPEPAAAAPLSASGALIQATLLQEACNIALAISGHDYPDYPVMDPWRVNHERRLRELEKIAQGGALSSRTCPTCKGAGTTKEMTQGHGPDDYEADAECRTCNGTGAL